MAPQTVSDQELQQTFGYVGDQVVEFKEFLSNLEKVGFTKDQIIKESSDVYSMFSSYGQTLADGRLHSLFNNFVYSLSPEQYQDSKLEALKGFLAVAKYTSGASEQVDLERVSQRLSVITKVAQIFSELNVKVEWGFILKLDEPEFANPLQKYDRHELKRLTDEYSKLGTDPYPVNTYNILTALLSWVPQIQKLENAEPNRIPSLAPYAGIINRWYKDGISFIRDYSGSELPVPFSKIISLPDFQTYLEREEGKLKSADREAEYRPLNNLYRKTIEFFGQDLAVKFPRNEKSHAEILGEGKINPLHQARINYVATLEIVKPGYFKLDSIDTLSVDQIVPIQSQLEDIKQVQNALENNWQIKSLSEKSLRDILSNKELVAFVIDPKNSEAFKEYSTKIKLFSEDSSEPYFQSALTYSKLASAFDKHSDSIRINYPKFYERPLLTDYHPVRAFKSESDVANVSKAVDVLNSYIDFAGLNKSPQSYLQTSIAAGGISITEIVERSTDPKRQEMAKYFGAMFAKSGTFSVNDAPSAVIHIFKIKNVDKAYQFFQRTRSMLTVNNFKDIPLE